MGDAFKQLINVIGALGMSDSRIIDEAKEVIRSRGTSKSKLIHFSEASFGAQIPFDDLVKQLQIKIWDRLSFAKSVVGESEYNRWMK